MSVDPFIEAEKRGGHSVKRACELLGVSRAVFYARRSGVPGPRAMRDGEPAERIAEVHARSRGGYGALRVHAQLQRDGQRCGRRRVARLMRALGLAGRYRRRRRQATVVDPNAGSRPDLIGRDFTPDAAAVDTRWCGDITYIPAEEGRLYLATVIDIASRRVVGWATADHLRTDLSRWSADDIAAVAAALNARPRKSLGWRTPAEAFNDHLDSLLSSSVATTPCT
ncbi:IS3 family transposase [Nonomuraea sp. NPDC050783]|uniref:IS3 family transposase n=1 Tax=Nonomuraea sp. NPDC050783 TaxID=3154634 RepID=UPI0034650B0A